MRSPERTISFHLLKLCSAHNEIAVHQIRTTTSAQQIGQPAPEGIHRDGVDLVGIFCVNRDHIEGGITSLYRSKNDREGWRGLLAISNRGVDCPVLSKILNSGEFLIFNDNQFFHYTSPITALPSQQGVRDVFVLTSPGLLPPAV